MKSQCGMETSNFTTACQVKENSVEVCEDLFVNLVSYFHFVVTVEQGRLIVNIFLIVVVISFIFV